MREYNFTEARNNFASVLEKAKEEGIICISKRNGESFYLTPVKAKKSPLDIEGIDLSLSRDEIVSIVQEGRNRRDF